MFGAEIFLPVSVQFSGRLSDARTPFGRPSALSRLALEATEQEAVSKLARKHSHFRPDLLNERLSAVVPKVGARVAVSSPMDEDSHIVVGYDGSTHCELALHRAVRMSASSPLGLVHVACFVEKTNNGVRLPSGEEMSRWAAVDYLRHTILRLARNWEHAPTEVKIAVHLRSGTAQSDEIARSLVDLAYRVHAGQIVVGVQGRGARGYGRVGRVAQAVLDYSDLPVHLEPTVQSRIERPTNLLRWAYVFGGEALRREQLKSCANRNLSGT